MTKNVVALSRTIRPGRSDQNLPNISSSLRAYSLSPIQAKMEQNGTQSAYIGAKGLEGVPEFCSRPVSCPAGEIRTYGALAQKPSWRERRNVTVRRGPEMAAQTSRLTSAGNPHRLADQSHCSPALWAARETVISTWACRSQATDARALARVVAVAAWTTLIINPIEKEWLARRLRY